MAANDSLPAIETNRRVDVDTLLAHKINTIAWDDNAGEVNNPSNKTVEDKAVQADEMFKMAAQEDDDTLQTKSIKTTAEDETLGLQQADESQKVVEDDDDDDDDDATTPGKQIDFSMTCAVEGAVLTFCCRSVAFLKHWPVQQLSLHPQACMFHYFNRGQVLVRDSNNSDWIYIVKSGSLSVMKKLHHVDASDDETTEANDNGNGRYLHLAENIRRKRKEGRNPEMPEVFRNMMEADRRLEQTLPGAFSDNDRLGLIDYDRIITDYRSRIQSKAGFEIQTSALPPIPAHEAQRESSSDLTHQEAVEPKKLEMMVTETAEGDRSEEDVSSTDKCVGTSRNAQERVQSSATGSQRALTSTDGSQCIENSSDATKGNILKGVYIGPPASQNPTGQFRADNPSDRKTSQESNSSEMKRDILTSLYSDGSPTAHLYRLNIDYQRKFREHVGRKTMADQLDYKGSRDFRYTEVDLNPMFVLAKVLEKGQYFGVSQLLYPEQPSLSLVSNGAELVVLSKKLFMEHANDACMRNLRKTESPFPAQDELQSSLQDFVNWKAHRARVYHRLVSGIERKQSRRKQFLPSMPPGRHNFRSGPV